MAFRSNFQYGHHGGHIENASQSHLSPIFGANELKLGMWVASNWTKNVSDGFCEIQKFDLDLTPELGPHPVFLLFALNIFFSETTGSIKTIMLELCMTSSQQ